MAPWTTWPLSLNQMTTKHGACPRRSRVAKGGHPRDRALAAQGRGEGLKEGGPPRAGGGPACLEPLPGRDVPRPTRPGAPAAVDDNRRAVDEAAELGTEVLVLVCGGPAEPEHRRRGPQDVADGIESLAPYAAERGDEARHRALHPMFAADRSVIVTLGHANDI